MAKVYDFKTGKMLFDTSSSYDFTKISEQTLDGSGYLTESEWDLLSLEIRHAEEIWFSLEDGSQLSIQLETYIDRIDARMISSTLEGKPYAEDLPNQSWVAELKTVRANT